MAFEDMDDECDGIRLGEFPEFLDLLDLDRAEIVCREPFGLLHGELEIHLLGGGFLEIDRDFLAAKVPPGDFSGSEGLVEAEISGGEL